MKIALLGYGKMGREIEKIALARRHQVVLKIDIGNAHELVPENLRLADVAIDFSTPGSAYSNIIKCFDSGVPVVSGTTGWTERLGEAKKICLERDGAFLYASNFSLGVQIFFALNRYLATLMDTRDNYNPTIEETHHIHKLDAPSGTAISIANDILSRLRRKKKWELNSSRDPSALQITAVREGEVPGTHKVTYESDVDSLQIIHTAKNRVGLALGAVLAAEFIQGKKGVFEMKDLLGL